MLLLTALVLFLLRYSKRWIYGLAALIALEMFLFAHHFKIETRLAPPYPQSWREIAANDPGDYRVLHIGLLTRNPVMAAGVQDVWGYSPLYMSRYSRLMEFVWRLAPSDKKENPRRLLVKNPILALLRCRYIFLNTGDKAVLRVPDMPRLLLIDDWLPMTDPDKIFKKLMDPGFDARKTVILEAPPDPLPVKSKRPAGTVALLGSGTDWLEFEAELSRPAILLITDGYSASWRVRPLVPGPQARYSVMPADYTLRAVPLTAGKHRLRMEYLPSAFVVGKWISLAALIAYAALCLYFLRRRPR